MDLDELQAAKLIAPSEHGDDPEAQEAGRQDYEAAGSSTCSEHIRKTRTAGVLVVGLLAAAVVAAAASTATSHSREPKLLNEAAVELEELVTIRCSTHRGQNCTHTKCCADPGMQCYEQDGDFAMCRPSCSPGPDPTHWDGKDWSCKELGYRTEGQYLCGKPGENCSASHCCTEPGMQCYAKDNSWATCKAECVPGAPDLSDEDDEPWSCKPLGERARGAAEWVRDQCSSGWDNCIETKCCKNPGEACYLQNPYFGECKALGSCISGEWSCEIAGSQTPFAPTKGGKLSPWVLETCNNENEGCLSSKCCLGMDVQCYEKNDGWAQCLSSCSPGLHADDNNETWSCKPLGPRSYGLAVKGSPSLFCFSVIRTMGYEAGLMSAQKAKGAGIFACDDHSLLSSDGSTTVGDESTIEFPGAPIVTSIDGTAGNTLLFINAWNAVMTGGKWNQHSFTAKVDPDAVFFPERLRWHVAPYIDRKIFVINCHMGDMVYGALEVYSFAAMREWSLRGKTCPAPNNFGEDKYMTGCMDHLGVARIHDESILGDKLCQTFSGCGNGWNSAFHPFKDVGSWEQCWNEANSAAK